MLCDKCKTNPATVHMERTVNGEKTEHNLCFQCAAALNFELGAELSFDNIIKEFLSGLIGQEQVKNLFGEEAEPEGPVCPKCGLSYEEFRAEGKLGCAECYNAFRQQVDAILKNIHGGSEHVGKFPRLVAHEILQKRELGELKRKLREAVENEEYEQAAELRDRIRYVESKGEA